MAKKKAPPPAPVGPVTTRVRYKSGNQAGTEADLPELEARTLIDSGFAVLVPGPKEKPVRASSTKRSKSRSKGKKKAPPAP